MLRVILFSLIFISLAIDIEEAIPSNLTIAILDFATSDKTVTAFDARLITDQLRNEIVNNDNKIIVWERLNIDRVLEEQRFVQSQVYFNPDLSTAIGRLLGVEYVIVGNVHKENNFVISCDIIDSENGNKESIYVEFVNNNFGEIEKAIERLSSIVIKSILK